MLQAIELASGLGNAEVYFVILGDAAHIGKYYDAAGNTWSVALSAGCKQYASETAPDGETSLYVAEVVVPVGGPYPVAAYRNSSGVRQGYDSTLADAVASAIGAGTGDEAVNHDTGGTDNLRYSDGAGAGIDNGDIKAYLKSDYDAGRRSNAYVKARSKTRADGRWEWDMYLDKGLTYTIVFYKQGQYRPSTQEVTI